MGQDAAMAATKPKINAHPIVDGMLRRLIRNESDEHSLEPATITEAQNSALAITSGQELYNVLRDWLTLVSTLDLQLNGKPSAAALADAAAMIVDRLLDLAKQEGDAGHDRAQAAKKALEKQRRALDKGPGVASGLAPKGAGIGGVGLRKRR